MSDNQELSQHVVAVTIVAVLIGIMLGLFIGGILEMTTGIPLYGNLWHNCFSRGWQ